jgi:hypothetical protein
MIPSIHTVGILRRILDKRDGRMCLRNGDSFAFTGEEVRAGVGRLGVTGILPASDAPQVWQKMAPSSFDFPQ